MRTGTDVELGPRTPMAVKRRKKRSSLRMPLSVAFGTLVVFLFFVHMGNNSSAYRAKSASDGHIKKVDTGQPTLFVAEIKEEYPHDITAFTQGLEYDERNCDAQGQCTEILWESTGLYGQSSVREVDLKTGNVLRTKLLPESDFGEGLTRIRNRLYQVTWKTSRAWSYSVDNFDDVQELKSPLTDGWGITNNGTHLIVGDSTDTLSFIDPVSMRIAKQVQVSDNGESIKWLNELEWVDGLIYANVYTTDCIAQIDPNTGGVVGWVVLSAVKNRMLTSLEAKGAAVRPDVLNGIAWDGTKSRLFVSGKLWPAVYEIELRPMYRDSKSTDVAAITQYVRETCIVPESRMALLGRR